MIVKKATQVGNPLIRAKARTVSNVKMKGTQKIIDNLIDSMRFHDLVGMAAPQIGKSARIFVTEIRTTKARKYITSADDLRVFINPRILSKSSKQVKGWEGCGSVASANLFAMVKRPSSLVIEAMDRDGNHFQLKAANLLARVIQHEMGHLNGEVFTDLADRSTYMSRAEYLKLRAKM